MTKLLNSISLSSESCSQAIAVLSGKTSTQGASCDNICILDVSAEYTHLWGGERDDWLGLAPKIVGNPEENQRLLEQINRALIKGELNLGDTLSGLDECAGHLATGEPYAFIEWCVTAMRMPGYPEEILVLTQRDISKRVEKETELRRLATTDMLTGLINRARFDYLIKHEMGRLKRYVHPFSLIMLDVDYFKAINDRLGHDVGDQVLATLSKLLEDNLRESDHCARWGGEEFMILAPETTLAQAIKLADKIMKCIRERHFPGVGNVAVSMGVVEAALQETQQSVLKRVDSALYRAKENGRDRVEYVLYTAPQQVQHEKGRDAPC